MPVCVYRWKKLELQYVLPWLSRQCRHLEVGERKKTRVQSPQGAGAFLSYKTNLNARVRLPGDWSQRLRCAITNRLDGAGREMCGGGDCDNCTENSVQAKLTWMQFTFAVAQHFAPTQWAQLCPEAIGTPQHRNTEYVR